MQRKIFSIKKSIENNITSLYLQFTDQTNVP